MTGEPRDGLDIVVEQLRRGEMPLIACTGGCGTPVPGEVAPFTDGMCLACFRRTYPTSEDRREAVYRIIDKLCEEDG